MDYNKIKSEFMHYLIIEKAISKVTANTYSTDAFYPERNYIGMNFKEIFVDEQTLEKCKELLALHFQNKGKQRGKPFPKAHVSSYMKAIKLLNEFLEIKYEGKII